MKKFKNLDLMAHQISTLMLRHEVPEDEVRHVFIGQGTVLEATRKVLQLSFPKGPKFSEFSNTSKH